MGLRARQRGRGMIHEKVRIWGKGEYRGDRRDGFAPLMTTYVLDGHRKRGAVLICPGGGYGFTSWRESEPVALAFNAAGYNAFVLDYSVAPRRHPLPLLDLSRALCLLRDRADEWNIHEGSIAVCGFSAGGHLAASLGLFWDRAIALEGPGIEKGKNRPDALILGYPVITSGVFAHRASFANLLGEAEGPESLGEVSLELHVGSMTPPVFLWHTFADASVPLENSLLFADALRRAGVPFEFHVYPEGVHGLSLATLETVDEKRGTDPHVAGWIGLCAEWLGMTIGA